MTNKQTNKKTNRQTAPDKNMVRNELIATLRVAINKIECFVMSSFLEFTRLLFGLRGPIYMYVVDRNLKKYDMIKISIANSRTIKYYKHFTCSELTRETLRRN